MHISKVVRKTVRILSSCRRVGPDNVLGLDVAENPGRNVLELTFQVRITALRLQSGFKAVVGISISGLQDPPVTEAVQGDPWVPWPSCVQHGAVSEPLTWLL